jgi:hypothetical protein
MSATLEPLAVTSGIFGFYIAAYSTYDKALGRFNFVEKLKDLFLVRVSAMWTIKELNKVAGLASLTQIGLALILKQSSPSLATSLQASTLLTYGINIGRVHGIFSMIEFRQRYTSSSYAVAMALGSLTVFSTFIIDPVPFPQIPLVQSVLSRIAEFGAANKTVSGLALISLALSHTLVMERAKGGKWFGVFNPQMRPAGKLSLVFAGAAVALLAGGSILKK